MNPKKYLEKKIHGWFPDEPNLNGVRRTMGRRNLANKPVLGVVLVSLGVAALLVSFLAATRTDTVIDQSFVLKPNEKFWVVRKRNLLPCPCHQQIGFNW
jgi:hypothetical protein